MIASIRVMWTEGTHILQTLTMAMSGSCGLLSEVGDLIQADAGWGRTPCLWEHITWEGDEAVAEATEGLVTGNCRFDSYMGGFLECDIDLEQSYTVKFCRLRTMSELLPGSVGLLGFELASPSSSAAEQACSKMAVPNA